MTTLTKRALTLLLVLTIVAPGTVRADDASEAAAEQHLREVRDQLKSLTQQLRDAQNQIVTAQAAQAASDQATKDLQAKYDDLNTRFNKATSDAATDQANAVKNANELNDKIATLTAQLGAMKTTLDTEKATNTTLTASLKMATDDVAKLKIQNTLLQHLVDDRESKNLALFEIGNEILIRYEKFSLGDALTAKEPFIGLTRTKLQNLVQAYKDKLLNQVVVSNQTPLPGVKPASPSEPLPKRSAAKPAIPAAENTTSTTQP